MSWIGTLRSERLQFATSINVRYKATACGLFSVLAIAGQPKKSRRQKPIKFSSSRNPTGITWSERFTKLCLQERTEMFPTFLHKKQRGCFQEFNFGLLWGASGGQV